MHYFLCLELGGFYVHGLNPPVVVVRHDRVLDADSESLQRGIELGMHIRTARTLFPEARHQQFNPDFYEVASRGWLDLILPYSAEIEREAPHRAFVNLTEHVRPEYVAQRLIRDLDLSLPYTVRVGAGGSRWIAQVAMQTGQTFEPEKHSTRLLLPISQEARERLIFLGYPTIASVQKIPLSVLQSQFGNEALLIFKACRGNYFEPLRGNYPSSSISKLFTFEGGTTDLQVVENALLSIAFEIGLELSKRESQSQSLGIFIELEAGSYVTFKKFLAKPVHSTLTCLSSLKMVLSQVYSEPIQSIRVTYYDLEKSVRIQNTLYNSLDQSHRSRTIHKALTTIQFSHGIAAIQKASEVISPRYLRARRQWEKAIGSDG